MLLLLNFRCKLLHQASSPAGISFDPCTPTKPSYTRSASLPAESHLVTCANPAKVSCKKQLECLAQLYSSCIAGEDTEDVKLTFLWALNLHVCCEREIDGKWKLWDSYSVQTNDIWKKKASQYCYLNKWILGKSVGKEVSLMQYSELQSTEVVCPIWNQTVP